MKTCNKCHVEKPLEDFGKQRYVKDGKKAVCKACTSENQKKYTDKLKEERIKLKETLTQNPDFNEASDLPELKPFTLKIGDKVKFLKAWETNREVGYGVIESMTNCLYIVFNGKYRTSFRKIDYQRGCKNVLKVRG